MNDIFTNLLNFLPPCFNPDPVKQVAFTFSRTDAETCRLDVSGGKLILSLPSRFAPDLEIDLQSYTVSEIVALINAHGEYTAELRGYGSQNGFSLADTSNDRSGFAYIYTSPLWVILKAISYELEIAREALRETLRQLTIPGSTDQVQDNWGGFFNVSRRGGEGNDHYGQRIITEFCEPKANNIALERIIKAFFDWTVQVMDITAVSGYAMIMNDPTTPINEFPLWPEGSRAAEPCCFEIIFPAHTFAEASTELQLQFKETVIRIKEAGTQGKLKWPDFYGEYMLMNNVNTPFHDTDFILAVPKYGDYYEAYI